LNSRPSVYKADRQPQNVKKIKLVPRNQVAGEGVKRPVYLTVTPFPAPKTRREKADDCEVSAALVPVERIELPPSVYKTAAQWS
jgi:hypothetical protein